MPKTKSRSSKTETVKASTTEEPPTKRARAEDIEKAKILIGALEWRINAHDDNRMKVQERLHSMCDEWRKQIDALEDGINGDLEMKFKEEDNLLQETLNDLRTAVAMAEEKRDKHLLEALKKARTKLLVMQTYKLVERALKPMRGDGSTAEEGESEAKDFTKMFELGIEKEVNSKMIDLSSPTSMKVAGISGGMVHMKFTRNIGQETVLTESGFRGTISYTAEMRKKGGEEKQ